MKNLLWIFSLMLLMEDGVPHASASSDSRPEVREPLLYNEVELPQDRTAEDAKDFVSQPRKKSTMLLNKLMNALHKAMEKEKTKGKTQPAGFPDADPLVAVAMPSVARAYQMDVQPRGSDERMFWKCYFNAVSCF